MPLHGIVLFLLTPLGLLLVGCSAHGRNADIVRVEPLGPGSGAEVEDPPDRAEPAVGPPPSLNDFCGSASAIARAAELLPTGQDLELATAAARPAVEALELLLRHEKLPKYFFFEGLAPYGPEVAHRLELGSPLVVAKASKAQLEWQPPPVEGVKFTYRPDQIMTFREEVVFPIVLVDKDYSMPISSVTVNKIEGTWKIASLGRRQLATVFLIGSLTYGAFNQYLDEELEHTSDLLISEKKFMYYVPSLGELFYAACEGSTLKLFPIYQGAFNVGDVLDFETVRAKLRERVNSSWSPN